MSRISQSELPGLEDLDVELLQRSVINRGKPTLLLGNEILSQEGTARP